MANNQVTKIYELRTLGFSDIDKDLKAVKKDFEDIAKAKRDASKAAADASRSQGIESEAYREAKKALDEQKIAVMQAQAEKKRLQAESVAMANVTKAEANAAKEATNALKAESGSYQELYNSYRQLYALTKNAGANSTIQFQGNTYNYDAAIEKLKELSTAEQDWRRQFSRDNLLVGEYTSGIVKAFKDMGLDDLVGGQIDKTKTKINELDTTFERLKQELSEVKVTGEGSLEAIEKQLIENRKEAQNLTTQVSSLENEFKKTSDVGSQISEGLKNGFKNVRGEIGKMLLGYVAFQQVYAKVTEEIGKGLDDAKQIEGISAAFKNLNRPDLLNNLRAATRGAVSDLGLMSRAVQANNFQIPLDQLSSLLDFARRRAKDTGLSVDYLVDSIVTGIGRKSPLILDNLGISAVRLKEKIKGVSEENQTVGDVAKAVAEIIAEENAKAGAEIDTNAEAVQRNQAQWENLRAEFAGKLLPILTAIGTLFLGLVTTLGAIPFPILVTGITLLTTAMINQYIATSIARERGLAYLVYLALQDIRTRAVALSTRIATAEITLFNGAIKISPLGIFLTLLGLIIPAVALFAARTKESRNEVYALNDVNRKANDSIAEQKARLDGLIVVVKDTNISLDTRKKALQELTTIDQRFNGILLEQKNALDKLNTAYGEVIKSIQLKAQVEASATLSAEKQKNVLLYSSIRQRLETEAARQKEKGFVNVTGFTSEEQKILLGGTFGTDATNRTSLRRTGDGIGFQPDDLGKIVDYIKRGENEATGVYLDYLNVQKKAQAEFDKSINGGTNKTSETVGKKIETIKAEIKALETAYNSLNATDLKGQKSNLAQRKKLQDELDKLEGKDSKKSLSGSKLSGQENDALKRIEAERDNRLAIYNLQIADARKNHTFTLEEETNYLRKIQQINDDADKKKITTIKGNNATQTATRAKLNLEIIDREKDTSDKILVLRKNQYDKDVNNENAAFEKSKADSEEQTENILRNINLTELERANITLQSHNEIQQMTDNHYSRLRSLSKGFQEDAAKIEADSSESRRNAEKQKFEDLKKLATSSLTDIENVSKDIENRTRNKYSTIANNILQNASLTDDQKKKQLERNEAQLSTELLRIAAAKALATLNATKQNFDNGQATQSDLNSANSDYSAAINALGINQMNSKGKAKTFQQVGGLSDYINQGGASLFGIDKDSDQYKVWSQTTSDAFQTAQNAMQNYYDIERIRIENSLKLQERQIDAQKRVALGKAQSSAEQDTIERQAEARRLAAEKEAFEKNKKMQIAQAKINLAMQLSNLAVVAFAPNPLNIATLGTAGAIMYAVQAALAIAGYAMNVSRINAAQFATGGKAGFTPSVPILGPGPINNPSNIPTQPNGDHILATVKKGEVILNEQQQNALGGPEIFKMLGVPGFAGGGLISTNYTGSLGSQYPAPMWYPSNNSNSFDKGAFDEFKESMLNVAESINKRIDRFEVVQVTSSVTNAQKKEVQQQSIGRL